MCTNGTLQVHDSDYNLQTFVTSAGNELRIVDDRIIGHDDIVLHVAILRHPVNGFLLELCKYDNPKGQQRELDNIFVGASHLAFEVEDVDSQYRALVAAGFSAINPPVDVERDGQVVARAMYGLDPDGISIEMFQEFGDIVSR